MAEIETDLAKRVEQLESLVSELMREIVQRTPPGERAGVFWAFDAVTNKETQFARDWAKRAEALGNKARIY